MTLLSSDGLWLEGQGGLVCQVPFELGNGQVQRLRLRAGARVFITRRRVEHQWADPAALEIKLPLLRDHVSDSEWLGRLVQQVEFKLGNGQVQMFRGRTLHVVNRAVTLIDDLPKGVSATQRFAAGVCCKGAELSRKLGVIADLLGHRAGERILPELGNAAQGSGIAEAVVACVRQIAYRCVISVRHSAR